MNVFPCWVELPGDIARLLALAAKLQGGDLQMAV